MNKPVDRQWFAQMMSILRAGYPNMFNAPEGPWRATIEVFYGKLSTYPKEVLRKASAASHDKFPDRLPSVGQFTQLVESIQKSYALQQRSAIAALPPSPRAKKTKVPEKWEKWAQFMEQENKYFQMHPDKHPGMDVLNKTRFKKFWTLWAQR